MNCTRRHFVQTSAAAIAASFCPAVTLAETAYPSRPVRLVLGFPVGGLSDSAARLLAPRLGERLGQPVIVDNKPGAVTNIATDWVLRSQADGYTVLMATVLNAINASVYDKLPFNFIRDATPIASILDAAFVLEVHPSVPATTVAELVAYAKAHPGKLAVASAGVGSPEHVASELFKMMAGVDMLHVTYKGSGPALTDLVAGQVQVYFGPVAPSVEYIKSGRLRGLAVTTSRRTQALPELPALAESLPGFEVSAWHGLIGPRNVPAPVVQVLNKAVNETLHDQAIQARFADLGITPVAGSPEDFRALIVRDTEKWANVVRTVGIKPEA
jgi:tripartite-type tricarboxylate transporter receptor subunit TctC